MSRGPTLAQVRDLHPVTFRRKRLGCAPISGRQLWASLPTCACGWSETCNQSRAEAEKAWRQHTRDAWQRLRAAVNP